MFKDKKLLITGGTGSFGNAVLNRFLETNISEIRIFSRDEKKQEDMRLFFKNPKVKFWIGDVRQYDSIDAAMKGIHLVFHAAALKQVPSCEFYPLEAVRTNILGAENVLNVAIANRVERVIVLSTDKAVYPINAMGLSKALMEKLMIAKSHTGDAAGVTFCATRYGNVMASRGSVIPLFVKQIKEGKDITVTDPDMTRFLMSLDESVDLVLYAYSNAAPGDIFVPKAPASTILDLAKALTDIFHGKSRIRIIGTRHGEKRHESLITREEMARAVDLGRYYRICADMRDLNYDRYFTNGQTRISEMEDYTSENTQRLSISEIKDLLLTLPYIQDQRHV